MSCLSEETGIVTAIKCTVTILILVSFLSMSHFPMWKENKKKAVSPLLLYPSVTSLLPFSLSLQFCSAASLLNPTNFIAFCWISTIRPLYIVLLISLTFVQVSTPPLSHSLFLSLSLTLTLFLSIKAERYSRIATLPGASHTRIDINLLFPWNCLGLINLKAHIWRLLASPVWAPLLHTTRQTRVSLIQNHEMLSGCFLVVDVLISCNLFEMLVKGVKRRGGGRGGWGGRAGRRVFLVKGNGARCRRGFPSPYMYNHG